MCVCLWATGELLALLRLLVGRVGGRVALLIVPATTKTNKLFNSSWIISPS